MKKIFLLAIAIIFISRLVSYSQGNRMWATYFGGSNTEYGCCTATDNSNNVYLAGNTYSSSGIAYNGFQNTYGGGLEDAFLTKFDSLGNRLWATYYGGSNNDEGNKVATDTAGNVYLTGITLSSSGIASVGAHQGSSAGGIEAYLVKFDAAGNRLWATYFGGNGNDYGYDVLPDMSGNIYIAGRTSSTSGIASGGFQNTYGGGANDAYLAKFSSSGNLIWATYYGGSGDDSPGKMLIDVSGNVYLTGYTSSTSGIAYNGFQNSIAGGYDFFLVKFDSSGNRQWATYYGGPGDENCLNNSAIDISGNIYIIGATTSTSGIASGGFQNTFGGGSNDAVLVKFSPYGIRLWATYYGGSDMDRAKGVDTDNNKNVFMCGETTSTTYIASGGFQNTLSGSTNAFLVEFDSLGNRLCATYYGQSSEYTGASVTDNHGRIYICGNTNSTSGIASGGFQNTYGGGDNDAFLVKFASCLNPLSGIILIDSLTCTEHCTASATISAQGGTPPYTYIWSTNPPQTTQTADSLCAGTYTVIITDGSSNSVTSSVVIANYPNPVVTVSYDSVNNILSCDQTYISYQWYLDATIINGATSQSYVPAQNGNYTVVITDTNGCIATCPKVCVTWLAIADYDLFSEIYIYPNPVNRELTIQTTVNNEDLLLSICDLQGRILVLQKLLKGKTEFDVSSFSKGLYLIKIQSENGVAVKKLIKE